MENFLTFRFILIFIFIGVASAAISAVLFSSQLGVLEWIAGLFSAMTPLRFFGITVATFAAVGISYTASRIGTDPTALGLVPVGSGYTYGRRLSTDSATGKTKLQLRTADDALNDLESMV
jgi:stage V sporulation protein K